MDTPWAQGDSECDSHLGYLPLLEYAKFLITSSLLRDDIQLPGSFKFKINLKAALKSNANSSLNSSRSFQEFEFEFKLNQVS